MHRYLKYIFILKDAHCLPMPCEPKHSMFHQTQKIQLFKNIFLKSSMALYPVCRKLSKAGWKSAWLSNDLLLKLRSKREMHNQWKQEHVNWGEYRDIVEISKDGTGESQVKSEQDWGKDMRNNQKESYKSTGQKRKSKESLSVICKQVEPVMTDTLKSEVPSDLFGSIFTWH